MTEISNNQYFVLKPSKRNHQFGNSLLKINCIKICLNIISSKNKWCTLNFRVIVMFDSKKKYKNAQINIEPLYTVFPWWNFKYNLFLSPLYLIFRSKGTVHKYWGKNISNPKYYIKFKPYFQISSWLVTVHNMATIENKDNL